VKRLFVAALLASALVLPSGSALAASVRYASPTGTPGNAPCATPQTACDLGTAINQAASGDDVDVLGNQGPYALGATHMSSPVGLAIHVHGVSGRAVLNFTTGGFSIDSGSTADGLSLTKSGPAGGTLFSIDGGARADRVIAKASNGDHAVFLRGGTLTNSVAWTDVPTGHGVVETDDSNTFRNDTIYSTATDSTTGLWAWGRAGDISNGVETVINTIARGGTTGFGVVADSESGVSVNVNAGHSNLTFSTAGTSAVDAHVNTDTSDQSSSPLFANAAAGDFHQQPASPTVDHGVTDAANGAIDIDGSPRARGAATDIGAYEYQPPPTPPTLNKPGSISKTTVTESTKGYITLVVANPNGVRARGDLRLSAHLAHKTVTVAHNTFSVAAHKTVKVKLRLSRQARAYLRTHARLKARAKTVLKAKGKSKSHTQTITIKAAKH
jgi:hypothetical protein